MIGRSLMTREFRSQLCPGLGLWVCSGLMREIKRGMRVRAIVGFIALLSTVSWAQERDLTVRLPAQPFGELPHATAPDYRDLHFWAAHPAQQDAANLVP